LQYLHADQRNAAYIFGLFFSASVIVPDDELSFPEDYLKIMESGPIDEAFIEALANLSPDQRDYLAHILSDRRARRMGA
jgi:hypothetical protein